MGRLAFERHIHFKYTKAFVNYYRTIPQEMKNTADAIGRPYGYSAMNVLFLVIKIALTLKYGGHVPADFLLHKTKKD